LCYTLIKVEGRKQDNNRDLQLPDKEKIEKDFSSYPRPSKNLEKNEKKA